jgi:hypothetical protein
MCIRNACLNVDEAIAAMSISLKSDDDQQEIGAQSPGKWD